MAVDLELGLVWDDDPGEFEVSLRAVGPGIDHMEHLHKAIEIDSAALLASKDDEDLYGEELSRAVFANPKIVNFFDNAIAAAGHDDLHFRIHVDRSAPAEYNDLRWESLRAPGVGAAPIATMDNIVFSRYLSSEDWRPITLHNRPRHRALVVIAAPSDLGDYRLAPVDGAAERERAETALIGYEIDVLCGGGEASLNRIATQLDRFDYEVLYLVSHGRLVDGEPHLVLEDRAGRYARVDGLRIAEQIRSLRQRPALAILLSCQSANSGSVALSGLGPRLSGAGIPAVIAMQGDVTMETARTFATEFFAAFRDEPVVDRAVAKARRSVREKRDWWAPVLFSRQRSSHVYPATPSAPLENTWEDILANLSLEEVTPVLGPGLSDGIMGSRSEIAKRWVRRWQMPIASYGHNNLAQVAQYLRVGREPGTVRTYLRQYLMTDLLERVEVAKEGSAFHGLPPELLAGTDPGRVISEVGGRMREHPDDPYRIASALPAKVFFTTGWTNLLQDAMKDRGKTPRTMIFPWTPAMRWTDLDGKDPRKWPEPTVESPYVCHLFGRLDKPDSLVLTEDDYFAWLSEWIVKRSTLLKTSRYLNDALTQRSLMFVGYQLRDWDFQVLYQSFQSFGGWMGNQYLQVGVQLMPDVDIIEPEAAKHYLESSLDKVRIFWLDARSFLAALRDRAGLRV